MRPIRFCSSLADLLKQFRIHWSTLNLVQLNLSQKSLWTKQQLRRIEEIKRSCQKSLTQMDMAGAWRHWSVFPPRLVINVDIHYWYTDICIIVDHVSIYTIGISNDPHICDSLPDCKLKVTVSFFTNRKSLMPSLWTTTSLSKLCRNKNIAITCASNYCWDSAQIAWRADEL